MNNICSICLSNINRDELCHTDCNHRFCFDCLDEWFNNKTITCPNCRGHIKSYRYKK